MGYLVIDVFIPSWEKKQQVKSKSLLFPILECLTCVWYTHRVWHKTAVPHWWQSFSVLTLNLSLTRTRMSSAQILRIDFSVNLDTSFVQQLNVWSGNFFFEYYGLFNAEGVHFKIFWADDKSRCLWENLWVDLIKISL